MSRLSHLVSCRSPSVPPVPPPGPSSAAPSTARAEAIAAKDVHYYIEDSDDNLEMIHDEVAGDTKWWGQRTIVIAFTIAMMTAAIADTMELIPAPIAENMEP